MRLILALLSLVSGAASAHEAPVCCCQSHPAEAVVETPAPRPSSIAIQDDPPAAIIVIKRGRQYGPYIALKTDVAVSPDGEHFAVLFPDWGGWHLVIDGSEPQLVQNAIRVGSVRFTEDSSSVQLEALYEDSLQTRQFDLNGEVMR